MSKEKIEAVLKYTKWMLEEMSEALSGNTTMQCIAEGMSSRDILQLCLKCVEVEKNDPSIFR